MDYTETSGDVARRAGVSQVLVQQYARKGLLEFVELANGTRLFRASAADQVRQLKADRLAKRRRHPANA